MGGGLGVYHCFENRNVRNQTGRPCSQSRGWSVNLSAVITLVLICGFVWGGFLLLLAHAVRSERQKAERRRA